MSTISIVLFVLAAAFAIWQLTLIAGYVALLRNPKVTRVQVGVGPGLLAVILTIVAVVMR